MNWKRIAAPMAAIALLYGFSACGQTATAQESQQLKVVTTIFPAYDWVRELAQGEQPQLRLLLDDGVDLHSYQPTAQDMVDIANCDLFIYVGGQSEHWVDDVLEQTHNPDRVVVNLMEVLGDRVKEEEYVQGMEHTHDHEEEHDHEQEQGHEEEHEHEDDEHIWLSLQNAEILCKEISSQLQKLDKDNQQQYQQNTDAYLEKLNQLDEQYRQVVQTATGNTLIFADRFPFRYLVDDYGLNYYAAFSGCSAETEASFETVSFLASKVQELQVPAVLTIEGSNQKIAKTVVENAKSEGEEILTMDSLQSIGNKKIQEGVTYLSVMEQNLTVLEQALQGA